MTSGVSCSLPTALLSFSRDSQISESFAPFWWADLPWRRRKPVGPEFSTATSEFSHSCYRTLSTDHRVFFGVFFRCCCCRCCCCCCLHHNAPLWALGSAVPGTDEEMQGGWGPTISLVSHEPQLWSITNILKRSCFRGGESHLGCIETPAGNMRVREKKNTFTLVLARTRWRQSSPLLPPFVVASTRGLIHHSGVKQTGFIPDLTQGFHLKAWGGGAQRQYGWLSLLNVFCARLQTQNKLPQRHWTGLSPWSGKAGCAKVRANGGQQVYVSSDAL